MKDHEGRDGKLSRGTERVGTENPVGFSGHEAFGCQECSRNCLRDEQLQVVQVYSKKRI